MSEMRTRMILFSFTRAGTDLNRRLCRYFRESGRAYESYTVKKYADAGPETGETAPLPEDMGQFIKERWGRDAFLFIGAAGIAVRFIAPWVRDKFTDSPVLVADEAGRHIIPILSGHMGGAAELADEIAGVTGAEAVHTTATDVKGKFAPDMFAKRSGLYITDRKAAKEAAAAALEGERIAFLPEYGNYEMEGRIPDEIILCHTEEEAGRYPFRIIMTDRDMQTDGRTLILKPRNVTAGIGCRRGIRPEVLEAGLESILAEQHLTMEQVERIASIDLKKDEPAIRALAENYRIPFLTFPADELKKTGTVTQSSLFVEETVGVDNVCERAAMRSCRNGSLVQGKSIRDSMTAALVRRTVVLRWDDMREEKE